MAPPIFAHLHSAPLVVRRRTGADWRSLSSHPASSSSGGSGLEAVELIDVKAERRLLLQCVRESERRLAWHSEVADLHAFRKVLSFGCRALHFSGHGTPGQIIFENKKGEAQFVSQQELKDLLLAGGAEARKPRRRRRRRHSHNAQHCKGSGSSSSSSSNSSSSSESSSSSSDEAGHVVTSRKVERGWVALSAHERPKLPLQLVFVSACHSESVAEAFVSVGVPHVVVVSKEDKVLDRKAMEFAKAFYTALFAGHSVAKAFQIGRVQADIAVAATGASTGRSEFKLLGDGDHNEAPFRGVPAGVCVETAMGGRRGRATLNECDAVAEVFVGRSLEVHQVYKALVEGARLVSVTGPRGVGKTEVALQCAQYATERRLFSRIFFLRLHSGDSSQDEHPGSSVTSSSVGCHAHSTWEADSAALVGKFAKTLGLQASTLEELADKARERCESEAESDGGSFLLVLDGCNRAERQNPRFRAIVGTLLRRVSSLALLLTGDGKLGAMDGVGEKIIAVGPLPSADAALLFTLRAPRKIRAHEMGGSTDLEAFGEHPIIKRLCGHPRTICAVSQFLEKKDMELDQREFLDYIIPSVNTGLCMTTFSPTECETVASHQFQHPSEAHSTVFAPCHQHLHDHHMETHQHHLQAASATAAMGQDPRHHMKSAASQPAMIPAKPSLETSMSSATLSSGVWSSEPTENAEGDSHTLVSSRSEPSLSVSSASTPATTSLQQLCLLKVADHVRGTVQSESGSLVWARAVVFNARPGTGIDSSSDDDSYSAGVIRQLQALQDVPLDWVAPQVSRFFAAKLKAEAAKRPLSLRSIDFLSKSSLVWGRGDAAPAQRAGAVSLGMFAAFWAWFRPLVDCISYSTLWPYTQPRLLHGFLSKGTCVSMLQRAPPGTFLLRFSETRVRCFVIAYVCDNACVQFVPVTCQPERGGWFVALQGEATASGAQGSGVTFPTLQELILSVNVLKFLFPQTPKETAFQLQS